MHTEEPQREVPVPSPHPSSGLEMGSSLLELTPEKPPPSRGKRRSGNRPVQLKQHDFLQNGRSPASTGRGGLCQLHVKVSIYFAYCLQHIETVYTYIIICSYSLRVYVSIL